MMEEVLYGVKALSVRVYGRRVIQCQIDSVNCNGQGGMVVNLKGGVDFGCKIVAKVVKGPGHADSEQCSHAVRPVQFSAEVCAQKIEARPSGEHNSTPSFIV
jgi:hypothetical protein